MDKTQKKVGQHSLPDQVECVPFLADAASTSSVGEREHFPELAAHSSLILYRMGGLRAALLYLLELSRQRKLPVTRVNALYCASDLSSFISMADTCAAGVICRHSTPGKTRPILLGDRLSESLIVDNLASYRCEELLSDPATVDVPFLNYQSVLRLPLFEEENYIFVVNFWSKFPNTFHREDLENFAQMLQPLGMELRANMAGLNVFSGSHVEVSGLSGREKMSQCPCLIEILKQAEHAASTDSTVLILGETGVGKESVADVIHEQSPRRNGPFIKVNCGAIPESLLDSELFGHEKGAFTGAVSTRPGYFEMADGGTIFLDEIGEMSLSAQVRLLRVLDSGCVMRVGAAKPIPFDVRVIAATHDDLPRRVVEGSFRKDLWYRISVLVLEVPPLRQRHGDIPSLVSHFIQAKALKLNLPYVPHMTEREISELFAYSWPGNVRELEHVVQRAVLKNSMESRKRDLHFEIMPLPGDSSSSISIESSPSEDLSTADWPSLHEHENRYIRRVLDHCGGKLTGADSATSILDIHYSTLRARLRQLGKGEEAGFRPGPRRGE